MQRILLSDALATLGTPKRSGKRIASEPRVASGDHDVDLSGLLGSERWFIWDCAGIWAEFETFQSAALDANERARRSNAENYSQLEHALGILRQLGDSLFCIAIEEDDATAAAQEFVSLVNVCSRHGHLSSDVKDRGSTD